MIDERLALLAVGLLKSRVIEDLQRARGERQRESERRARAAALRHRAVKGRRRPGA